MYKLRDRDVQTCYCDNDATHRHSLFDSCKQFNTRKFERYMADETLSLEEKNDFRESKDNFELEYRRACAEFREQAPVFESTYVCVKRSVCTCELLNRACCYYLPRNFTLYSLVQRHLCESAIRDNNAGFHLIAGRSLQNLSNCKSWQEPLSMMRMSRLRFAVEQACKRQYFQSPGQISDFCLEWLRQHKVSVDEDRLALKDTVNRLLPKEEAAESEKHFPRFLQDDLFAFLLYYSFEGHLVWGAKPKMCECCIDLEDNYFFYKICCDRVRYVRLGHNLNHKDKLELLVQLPVTIWSPP